MNLLNYYRIINPYILERIPKNAQRVVEVGCAAGILGKHYKLTNPNCEYIGIEIDEKAAKYAKYELDRVILGNAEEESVIDQIEKKSVDCIVYGDVLEHMVDPWGALSWHRSWLKDDGIIIICMPNVGHISVVAPLLAGFWTYEDSGLLDRTHLRFFTIKETHGMISAAGYDIKESIVKMRGNEKYSAFEKELVELVKKHNINQNLQAQLSTFQYVITASKRLVPFDTDYLH